MKVGEPDVEALRALFAELEFTSLLKELLPVVEVKEGDYREIKSKAEFDDYLGGLGENVPLALAIPAEHGTRRAVTPRALRKKTSLSRRSRVFWLCSMPDAEDQRRGGAKRIAVSNAPGAGAMVALEDRELADRVKSVLEDAAVPKTIHDLKSALHYFRRAGNCVWPACKHDPMLYSYLLDPTYSSHSLPEVALRRFNVKLSGNLAEAADVTGRLASALRKEVEDQGLTSVYEEIDAPLVPVLARMEDAGVKIDLGGAWARCR